MLLLNHIKTNEFLNCENLKIDNDINIDLELIKDKFYKVFELNPCPISISDIKTGILLDVNQSFLDLIKVKNKYSVIGKKTTEKGLNLIDKKDKDLIIRKILKEGYLKNYFCTVRNIENKKIRVLFSGSIVDFNGKSGLMLICQTINKRSFFGFFKTLLLF